MPDAYTHLRTARHALALSGGALPCKIAFLAGANGPDPFLFYRFWQHHPDPDLPALAQRLHREKAGLFLLNLAELADTPAQRSYAAGFVIHNTLDSLVHPYLAALTAPGGPCSAAGGHCRWEAGLDCTLSFWDAGRRMPLRDETAPPLRTAQLGETAALLVSAVQLTYGQQLPFAAVVDAFTHFRLAHWFFRSRFGVKKGMARLIDLGLGRPGFVSSHMQPARLRTPPPSSWTDPYTGRSRSGGLTALITAAEDRGAQRLRALQLYWAGSLSEAALAAQLGSASYETGLDC